MVNSEGDAEAYQSDERNQEILSELDEAKGRNYEPEKETRTQRLNNEDTDIGFDMDYLDNTSTEYSKDTPFTDKVEDAIAITPSGRLIDGMFEDGYRQVDHDQLFVKDGWEAQRQALEEGAVLIDPEDAEIKTYDGTLNNLSKEAKKRVEELLKKTDYKLVDAKGNQASDTETASDEDLGDTKGRAIHRPNREKAIKHIETNGGGTLNPETFKVESFKSGYMVSAYGREVKIPQKNFTEADLYKYSKKNMEPGYKLGV
jgi:hypothetical protein